MARTDNEVIEVLKEIYAESFGGKSRQRFLISWSDLRMIYGFGKLFQSRFDQLSEAAYRKNLYLWDLGEGESGHLIAVIRSRTIDRWRRVPKKIAETYYTPPQDESDTEEDDSE